ALDTVHPEELINYLKEYNRSEEIEGFVIGLPLHADGAEMEITRKVKLFGSKLKKSFPAARIFYEDERYTSKMAAQSMVSANFKRKDRRKKENIDKISAVLILQSFMEKDY
ncbi:MAG: Holliday junction resolvase RuvX, partial [Chitinophagales bacterium]|nr:Holliday junction resolvase RuvX [Chitinophagales bacterium]